MGPVTVITSDLIDLSSPAPKCAAAIFVETGTACTPAAPAPQPLQLDGNTHVFQTPPSQYQKLVALDQCEHNIQHSKPVDDIFGLQPTMSSVAGASRTTCGTDPSVHRDISAEADLMGLGGCTPALGQPTALCVTGLVSTSAVAGGPTTAAWQTQQHGGAGQQQQMQREELHELSLLVTRLTLKAEQVSSAQHIAFGMQQMLGQIEEDLTSVTSLWSQALAASQHSACPDPCSADGISTSGQAGSSGVAGGVRHSSKSSGTGGGGYVVEMAELVELRSRLSKMENSRDELARNQGQYKAVIAKLEGAVASSDRRIRSKEAENEQLKARCLAAESELATAQAILEATPDRVRVKQKLLSEEAAKAQAAAQSHGQRVAKLMALAHTEAMEIGELRDFLIQERQAEQELVAEMAAELQHQRSAAAAAQAAAEVANERATVLADEVEDLRGQAYYAKEQIMETSVENAQLHAQLAGLQAALAASTAKAAAAADEAQAVRHQLAETQENSDRMLKQMRGVLHLLDRHSGAFAKMPELTSLLRSLKDWVARQHLMDGMSEGGGACTKHLHT